jgi:hypothetical protein
MILDLLNNCSSDTKSNRFVHFAGFAHLNSAGGAASLENQTQTESRFLRTATSGAAYPDDFTPDGALDFNFNFYKYASPDGLSHKYCFAGFTPLTFCIFRFL